MATRVELFEALQDRLGTEAARMLAESIPEGAELATRGDIGVLRTEIADVRTEITDVRTEITDVRTEITGVRTDLERMVERSEERLRSEIRELHSKIDVSHHDLVARIESSQKETTRWMLGFFAPLWVGVYGVLALVVVKVLKP